MHDHHSHGHTHTVEFPTSTEGLPEARRPEVVELSDGDEFELRDRSGHEADRRRNASACSPTTARSRDRR